MTTPARLSCSQIAILIAILVSLTSPASASLISNGSNGIDAIGLGLNGTGIAIGQVEVGRPGSPGFDNVASSNANVTPAGVFEQNFNATPNRGPVNHASQVASVMISKGPVTVGVAPGASLYSGDDSGPDMISSAMTANTVDRITGMRAVNHSFGIGGALNGSSLYTSFIDWSASRYDVLNVIAGNETGPSLNTNIPTDSFNGVTVAFTTQAGGAVFDDIDPSNVFNRLPTNGRRTVDIAAPGRNIQMDGLNNVAAASSGTSFAAPHVTGATALLQQFSQNRRLAAAPRFDADSQHHETMKAVLMNSADKRTGVLGMNKTILRTDGDDWVTQRQQEVAGTDGPAINRDFVPLDLQMGTGQLNARRAVAQLTPGEYDPGAVPLMAWDYHAISGASGSLNRYQLSPALADDDWISITLAWDRQVPLNETAAFGVSNSFDGETFIDVNNNNAFNPGEPFYDYNGNNTYNAGVSETFGAATLTDLDLFLVPRGMDFTMAVARSISSLYSVEHIFYQIEETQQYDILVRRPFGGISAQNYALAWWSVPEPTSLMLFTVAVAACSVLRRRAAYSRQDGIPVHHNL